MQFLTRGGMLSPYLWSAYLGGRMNRQSILAAILVFALSACSTDDSNAWLSDNWGAWDGAAQDILDVTAPPADKTTAPEDITVPPPEETVEQDISQGPKPGGPCEQNSECYGAPCVPTPDGLQCSMTCKADCAGVAGWTCYPKVDEWAPGLCLQPDYFLCQACMDAADCIEPWSTAHYNCAEYANGSRYCAKDCESAEDCPAGYSCEEAIVDGSPADSKQCMRTDEECPCDDFHEGGETVCQTENEFGICDGFLTCTATGFDCDALIPLKEECNGEDDNCNGEIDEEMGTVSCGQGVCEHDVAACEDGYPAFCNPMEGMGSETCNGLDDNCNGTIDDQWPELGEPCDSDTDDDFCKNGTWECTANGLDIECVGDGEATDEVCDGVDNDCDGQIDEGFGKTTCGIGLCEKTVQNCLDGEPQECDPDDGAEDTDLPDLEGIDSNCDGVDGDKELAIFVDAQTGSDGGDGTPEAPLKSLDAAQEMAISEGLTQIYLSKGTYPEPFVVVGGIDYYGLFNAGDGWSRSAFNPTYFQGSSPALTCTGQTAFLLDGFQFTGAHAAGAGGSAYGAKFTNCSNGELIRCTITAGNATSGIAGSPGQTGQSGGGGNGGSKGCAYGGGGCGNCQKPAGGLGGSSPCGAQGANGGSGGAHEKSGDGGNNAVGGAQGGGGGSASQNGNSGQAGGAATPGVSGDAGAWNGSLEADGFIPTNGVDGSNGGNGHGGGGGGGGGGDNQGWCGNYGASGGGGGGGGCGGTKGTAGKGGGGSFGLYLVDAELELDDVKVYSGYGGDGGDGGKGGNGGSGGSGANGGAAGQIDNEGGGGKGGSGSKGGDGGHGSGGPGGPSFAVVCVGSTSISTNDSSLIPSTPGDGGSTPAGGFDGPDGPSDTLSGCD
jgi:hypothetical protein